MTGPPHTVADPVGDSDRTGEVLADALGAGPAARVVFLSSGGAERRHGVGQIALAGATGSR